MIKNAILMAAGLGTRLQPFTLHETKALVPVMGVPIAQFAVDSIVDSGATSIVANIHHLSERARIGLKKLDTGTLGSKITLSDETQKLLGSGGGIRTCYEHLNSDDRNEKDPAFLLNADVLWDIDLNELAAFHKKMHNLHGVTLTLAVNVRKNPQEHPGSYREISWKTQDSLMTNLGQFSTSAPFFGGTAVIEFEAISHLPAFSEADFIKDILTPALALGRVAIFPVQNIWYDVGSPELWMQCHFNLMKHLEMGTLSPRLRKRLEEKNYRLTSCVWADRTVSSRQFREILEPAYLSTNKKLHTVGPRLVFYDDRTQNNLACDSLSRGVFFGGEWVSESSLNS